MTERKDSGTLRGCSVVVTGANRGLGLELCRQLAALGARVVGTARDPRSAFDLRALEVRVESLDVRSRESVQGLAERLADVAVDILINNAGVGGDRAGIADLDDSRVAEMLDVNTLGPLRVTGALLPHLRRGRRRQIVNISSQMGSLAANTQGGYYAYRMSKTALNMLTRNLALELAGQGFICVSLHPGWVRTSLGGPSAPLTAEESVRGLLRVITGLRRSDSGRFIDHRGAPLAW